MGLVDYSDSDSDGSETEVKPVPKPLAINKKPAFQKLTSSSTGKIQVSLPTPAAAENNDEHPAKRTKIGAGAFSGFNSFLPPPKKTGAAGLSLPAPKSPDGNRSGSGRSASAAKRAPITLKGAGPVFSRSRGDEHDADGNYDDMGALVTSNGGGMGMSLPSPKSAPQPVAQGKPAEDVKMVGLGKPMQFKPLSVGRKVIKKKKKTVDELRPAEVEKSKVQAQAKVTEHQPAAPPKPKGSLFSVPGDDEDDEPVAATTSGKYEPMIYGAHTDRGEQNGATDEVNPYMDTYNPSYASAHQISYTQNQVPFQAPSSSSTLSDIASDLHLSASERRQLFGRSGRGGSQRQAANVKNFNMDAEYAHNEEVRASGETVSHNPVRAIAPGKHSLQQLVSQVQNQKEALEESFAKGYANRREASSRYGW